MEFVYSIEGLPRHDDSLDEFTAYALTIEPCLLSLGAPSTRITLSE
jgi:hypothetical protein